MHFRRPFLRGPTLQGETRLPTMRDPTSLLAGSNGMQFPLESFENPPYGTGSDRLKALVGLYD